MSARSRGAPARGAHLQYNGLQLVQHRLLPLPAVEAHPAAARDAPRTQAPQRRPSLHLAAEGAEVLVQPPHVVLVNLQFFCGRRRFGVAKMLQNVAALHDGARRGAGVGGHDQHGHKHASKLCERKKLDGVDVRALDDDDFALRTRRDARDGKRKKTAAARAPPLPGTCSNRPRAPA